MSLLLPTNGEVEDKNGSTLLKSWNLNELNFYNDVGNRFCSNFIGDWTPKFYGTVTMRDRTLDRNLLEEKSREPKEMLVLENLAHRFIKPNILELKLGNQLEDLLLSNINAPKEDQQQLERSTFLQVWDSNSKTFIRTETQYINSNWPTHLQEILSRLFTLPPSFNSTSNSTTSSTSSSSSSASSSSSSIPISATSTLQLQSLPTKLLKQISIRILSKLYQLWKLLLSINFRMIGVSLIIVYEGEVEALSEALAKEKESSNLESSNSTNFNSSNRESSTSVHENIIQPNVPIDEWNCNCKAVLEGDSEEIGYYSDESTTSSISTTDSFGIARPHTRLAFNVRLVNFTNTILLKDGEGPDEGVLKSLDCLVKVMEGLIRKIEEEEV